MKRILLLSVALAVIFGCLCPEPGFGQATAEAAQAAPVVAARPSVVTGKTTAPGVEMAQALSTITGVAISPLLGVSAVGAWRYFEATPVQRANLPWFAQPWFWGAAFFVVTLCFIKDSFGTAMPVLLKKPLDVLETIEHKVSGLVAVGAFVPLVATVFASAGANVPASLKLAGAGTGHGFLAVIDPSWFGNVLSVAAMTWVFLIVFLASNAINILILLSPFPIVDAALKLFRLFVLGTVVVTSLMNPWLGAVWSVMIILIAALIAGWSLRLWHFGMVFIWETCTRRAGRFTPDRSGNRMFLSRKINKTPIRTYGKLFRNDQGALIFLFRPWLVLRERSMELPAGTYAVSKGLFYSEIVRVEGAQTRSVLLLPPRFRTHEIQLMEIYGLANLREAGLRAAFAWLREWIGFKPKPPKLAMA